MVSSISGEYDRPRTSEAKINPVANAHPVKGRNTIASARTLADFTKSIFQSVL